MRGLARERACARSWRENRRLTREWVEALSGALRRAEENAAAGMGNGMWKKLDFTSKSVCRCL